MLIIFVNLEVKLPCAVRDKIFTVADTSGLVLPSHASLCFNVRYVFNEVVGERRDIGAA